MGSKKRWYKFPNGMWHRGNRASLGAYFFDCGSRDKSDFFESIADMKQTMPNPENVLGPRHVEDDVCRRCRKADEKRRGIK